MADLLTLGQLGVESSADCGALDNLNPPPMDNAVSAMGLNKISITPEMNVDFIQTMKGPAL